MDSSDENKKEDIVDVVTHSEIEFTGVNSPFTDSNRSRAVDLRHISRVTRLDTEFSNDPYSTTSLRKGDRSPRRTIRQIFRDTPKQGHNEMPNNSEEIRAVSNEDIHLSRYNQICDLLMHTLGAIGVVYGDLGTSPIYTLGPVFSNRFNDMLMPAEEDIIGALSNLLWLLFIVVCIKYCIFVLAANYNGEGGTFAMYELLVSKQEKMSKISFSCLAVLVTAAASLLIGDATITPAISVLAALEGISQVQTQFSSYIVYVAVVILAFLFSLQYKGTKSIGLLFGPVLLLWFILIGCIGIYSLSTYGGTILQCLNPYRAIKYWLYGNYAGKEAFINTSNIILCLTGSEVMFADMGHFGRNAINLSWFTIVFPSLFLQYLGQGAYLLYIRQDKVLSTYSAKDKEQLFSNLANSPFWAMIPRDNNAVYFYYFVIVAGTLATIIASQSVITGSFTLMNQASALNFFPRLNVVYTNSKQKGQVYIGSVCLILGISCIIITLIFQHSAKLTAAFGAAVTSVFLLTTIIMCFFIAPLCWKYRPFAYISLFLFFGTIDVVMWTSSITKILYGAWLPLLLGSIIMGMMFIWSTTRQWISLSYDAVHKSSLEKSPLSFICQETNKEILTLEIASTVNRSEGLGIFLTSSLNTIPLALTRLSTRLCSIPKYILLVYVHTSNEPFIGEWERVLFKVLEKKENSFTYSVVIQYGWAEPLSSLNLLKLLRDAALDDETNKEIPQDMLRIFSSLTYDDDEDSARFLDYDYPLSIFTTTKKVKAAKNKNLFRKGVIGIYKFLKDTISPTTLEYFRLPPDNTTDLGVSILA